MSHKQPDSFWYLTGKTLRQKRVVLISFLISFAYILLIISLPNKQLISETLFGNFPFFYKVKLISIVLMGDFSLLSPLSQTLMVLTGIFVGLNLSLFITEVSQMKRLGKLQLTAGTGTLLGLAITGCSSCGFSLLSLFGVSLSLGFIPFGDILFRSVALLLVMGSTVYLLRKNHEVISCKISKK